MRVRPHVVVIKLICQKCMHHRDRNFHIHSSLYVCNALAPTWVYWNVVNRQNSATTLLNEFQFAIVEFLSTLDWSIIQLLLLRSCFVLVRSQSSKQIFAEKKVSMRTNFSGDVSLFVRPSLEWTSLLCWWWWRRYTKSEIWERPKCEKWVRAFKASSIHLVRRESRFYDLHADSI